MVVRLAIRLVVLAVIIGVVAKIVPGIHVHGGFLWLLWVALIFSAVNMILGPLFRLISVPLIVVTLGLFLIVVNAALLAITAGLTSHLDVDNFGSALLGGLLIGLFSWLAELLLPMTRRGKHARPVPVDDPAGGALSPWRSPWAPNL
jgi:putative membrane protein